MNYGEERNIGSDAQSHNENREDGKAGIAGESANTESKIAEKRFQRLPAPGVARLIAESGGIAEGAERGATCFFGAGAGGDVLGDLLVEVELQLVLQLLRRHGRGEAASSIA